MPHFLYIVLVALCVLVTLAQLAIIIFWDKNRKVRLYGAIATLVIALPTIFAPYLGVTGYFMLILACIQYYQSRSV